MASGPIPGIDVFLCGPRAVRGRNPNKFSKGAWCLQGSIESLEQPVAHTTPWFQMNSSLDLDVGRAFWDGMYVSNLEERLGERDSLSQNTTSVHDKTGC